MIAERLQSALRSSRLTLLLLLALAALSLAGTLPGRSSPPGAPPPRATAVERLLGLQETFSSPLFLAVAGLLTLNVLWCTLHRFRRRRGGPLAGMTDVTLHLSLVLVIAGGGLKAAGGVVRTVMVPAGTETRTVYDWKAAADVPLGFALRVERLELGYYPLRARIGLRDQRTGGKLGVVEVAEGGAGAVLPGGRRLELARIEPGRRSAVFVVRAGDREERLSLGLTPGPEATAQVDGLGLTMLAFRDDVRTARVLASITRENGYVTEAWLAPNASLGVEGTQVCLTGWGQDEFGNDFAGFQVSRDPGAPLFWLGCVLFACAVPLHFIVKARRRPGPH